MKLPAIVSAILALIAIGLLFFIDFGTPDREPPFVMESLTGADAEDQSARLEKLFSRQRLPSGREAGILGWIYQVEQPDGMRLVRERGRAIERFPEHLADAVIELFKAGDPEAGFRALRTARELYPNNPDILSAAGIVAFLAGRMEEARRFLEQAEAWQKDDPRADFYLGGVLIQSDSVADRTRGKNLLDSVALGRDAELSELAALILLTNQQLPVLQQQKRALFDVLQERNAFRRDNENLNADALRALSNAAAPIDAKLAHELAGLLMEFPETTLADKIGYIRMSQNLGLVEEADALLKEVQAVSPDSLSAEQQTQLNRLVAYGHLLAGRYPDALEAFRELCRSQPENPMLHELFQRALSLDLPLDFQRDFFPLYLELPVLSGPFSLVLLDRLIEIAPLNEKDWLDHAAIRLLPGTPLQTARWLIQNNGGDRIVPGIRNIDTPLTREQHMALIEGHLAEEELEEAQAALAAARETLYPVHAEYYQARIHNQAGKRELAQEYWQAAHNAALGGDSYEMMKTLGFMALELEQPVNALQSLYAAFSAGIPFTPQEAGRLIDLTLQYGSLRQSINVAEFLRASFPGEAGFINNLAYFKFLAEEDLDPYVAEMRKLVDDYPDIVQYRLTLALGLLKSGRQNEANRLLQSVQFNWDETSTRGQLIYAAVLAANNQRVVAEGLLRNLDLSGLMPEEKALVGAP